MALTQKDLAERLSVSQVTVSRALRGEDNVKPALRHRIIKEAERVGYPIDDSNCGARRVRRRATRHTALAVGVATVAGAQFSGVIRVSAIAGAAVRTLPEVGAAAASMGAALALGGFAALVSGIGAIWLFVRMLRSQRLYRYAYYTWAAGGAFLVWLALDG